MFKNSHKIHRFSFEWKSLRNIYISFENYISLGQNTSSRILRVIGLRGKLVVGVRRSRICKRDAEKCAHHLSESATYDLKFALFSSVYTAVGAQI